MTVPPCIRRYENDKEAASATANFVYCIKEKKADHKVHKKFVESLEGSENEAAWEAEIARRKAQAGKKAELLALAKLDARKRHKRDKDVLLVCPLTGEDGRPECPHGCGTLAAGRATGGTQRTSVESHGFYTLRMSCLPASAKHKELSYADGMMVRHMGWG